MLDGNYDDDDDDDDDDFNIQSYEPKSARSAPPPTHRLTYVQKLKGARERRGTLILEEQQKALAAGDNKMQNTIVIYLS